MATSTEEIALWILAALKEEQERDPSLLTCRTESVVLGALKPQHNIEDADINRGIKHLLDLRALNATNRNDGRAAQPNAIGLKILAEYASSLKLEAERKQNVRQKWYTIIISILALVVAYLTMRSLAK